MLSRLSIFVSLVLALALATSAVHAEQGDRTFPLEGFTAIALKGSSNLELTQGSNFSVTAHGEEEDVAYAKAEVKNGTLELSVEPERKSLLGIVKVISEPEVKFRVTLPAISALHVTGSGNAGADTLESEKLDLRVTGSGVIQIEKVAAESLSTGVTGSGDLVLGTVLAVHGSAGITGSGDIRMDNFIGEDFSGQIKGSGDMAIGGKVANLQVSVMGSGDFVGRNLSATNAGGSVMGSGDIVLKRPVHESFSVMGSGDVALVD